MFERCEIKTVGRKGYVVQSRNGAGAYGYVFVDSKITGDPGITGIVLARIDVGVYPGSQVAYVDCEMGSHIAPEGWTITGGARRQLAALLGVPEQRRGRSAARRQPAHLGLEADHRRTGDGATRPGARAVGLDASALGCGKRMQDSEGLRGIGGGGETLRALGAPGPQPSGLSQTGRL